MPERDLRPIWVLRERTAEEDDIDAVHRLLAYAVVGAAVVGLGWSVVLAVTGRGGRGRPAFERFQAAVVAVIVVAAASGLLMLVTGNGPHDGLHLLYAAVAVGLVPLARSFAGPSGGRAGRWLLAVAFLVLAAVVYRLFATG